MSVLLVSDDSEAVVPLRSALERAGQLVRYAEDVGGALASISLQPPLVLVADSALEHYGDLLRRLRERAPHTRAFLLSDPQKQTDPQGATEVTKPFDAAEFAQRLAHETAVAELEQNQRDLSARAEDLARLVDASFDAIVGLKGDGTICSWNPGAAALYGYSAAEMVGHNISLIELESAPLLPEGERDAREVRRRHKSGRELLVLRSRAPVGGEGQLACAEISVDLTQRRALERELEHKERLAGLGRLTANMAHEISNPLAVLRASLPWLREACAGDHSSAEVISDMELAVDRIHDFVRHVRGYARQSQSNFEDLPLAGTVDIAVRLVKPRARERHITLELRGELGCRVPHEPPRLAQALVNLIANAIDASPDHGEVALNVAADRGGVRVDVDDQGPGIAPQIAARLFEPFATTKPPHKGTGLGLAITRQIVAEHHGHVELLPRPGGGTRAVFWLPGLDAASFRVLVLEPDPLLCRALSQALKREGFSVESADGWHEARELMQSTQFELIISPLTLKGLANVSSAEAIQQACPGARRLVLTDQPGHAVPPGMHARLNKPWDQAELLEAVRAQCLKARPREPANNGRR